MMSTRTLALAGSMAALLGTAAVPAVAQGQAADMTGQGYETQVLRSDSWRPGFTKDDDGSYRMIVPDTRDEADGMPMTVLRSDAWQPGYVKSSDGDYVMLVPAQEATGDSVTVLRSDSWQPGYMKSDDGDYIMIIQSAQTPQ